MSFLRVIIERANSNSMMKSNRFRSVIAGLLVAGAAVSTHAEGGPSGPAPLLTVRFNQARVYYDQQLYSAISQAVAVKPEVTFDVVSYAPSTGNSSADEKWIIQASRNTQSVVAAMQRIGVPMERITVTGQTNADLRFDETRIYVK